MARKKEKAPLPRRPVHDTLKKHWIVLPQPPYQPNTKKEAVIPPPEEPKFYGADFAILIQSLRKMGTLRERNAKRAGLAKGMRIMSHTHPDADSPSIADIDLVILDIYHGKLADVFREHKLAFFLDGIWSINEAIGVLQKFSQDQISRYSEIDYFSFIPAFVFDEMEEQNEFLSLPVEQAMSDSRFANLFYPSLCQTLVWHGLGLMEWIGLLEKIGSITSAKAQAWREFRIPESQNCYYDSGMAQPASHIDSGMLQELLDNFGLDDQLFRLCVLGDLEAFKKPEIKTRYLIIPCSICHDEVNAIIDQAAGNAVVRWANEQEIEDLTAGSDGAPWDQAYSYLYPDDQNFSRPPEPIKSSCLPLVCDSLSG